MEREVYRLEHVSKMAAGKKVLKSVSFRVLEGETVAVLCNWQEKGALSALMNGSGTPDGGRLYIEDAPVEPDSVEAARAKGVYYLDGKGQMISTMTVARNIHLYERGKKPLGFIHDKQLERETDRLLRAYGLGRIAASTPVSRLRTADILLLEVVCYAMLGAKIIILDEIGSSISGQPMQELKHILQGLNERGVSILMLSTKYDPLFAELDKTVIIRKGTATKVLERGEITRDNVLLHLTTHYATGPAGPEKREAQEVYCRLRLPRAGAAGPETLFEVRRGEVLGLWDIDLSCGAALAEIILDDGACRKAFVGAEARAAGGMLLGRGIALSSSATAPDRIFPDMDIYDNITFVLGSKAYNGPGIINNRIKKHMARHTLELIHADGLLQKYKQGQKLHGISSIDRVKIIVAKWLCTDPGLFVFVNPFGSLDDLTIPAFYAIVKDLQALGIAVVMSSVNCDILQNICDRILKPAPL